MPALIGGAIIGVAAGYGWWDVAVAVLLYNVVRVGTGVWALRTGLEHGMKVGAALGASRLPRALPRIGIAAGLLAGMELPRELHLQAIRQGINYKVAKIDYSTITRAIAMRKTTGFFNILVSNDDEMRILGMRALGEHASSAIQAVALLIYMNKGIEELGHMLHPHPSIIEGIQ